MPGTSATSSCRSPKKLRKNGSLANGELGVRTICVDEMLVTLLMARSATPVRSGSPPDIAEALRGAASVDVRTNTLFIQDTGGRLEEARRLITQLDVPVRQVLIEARIVIADDKWGRQLGARFGTQSLFNTNNYNVGMSGTLTDTSQVTANNPASRGSSQLALGGLNNLPSGAQPEQLNVNLPVTGAAGSLALTILNLVLGTIILLVTFVVGTGRDKRRRARSARPGATSSSSAAAPCRCRRPASDTA